MSCCLGSCVDRGTIHKLSRQHSYECVQCNVLIVIFYEMFHSAVIAVSGKESPIRNAVGILLGMWGSCSVEYHFGSAQLIVLFDSPLTHKELCISYVHWTQLWEVVPVVLLSPVNPEDFTGLKSGMKSDFIESPWPLGVSLSYLFHEVLLLPAKKSVWLP